MREGFRLGMQKLLDVVNRDGANPLFVARALQVVAAFATSVIVVWSFGLAGAGSLALSALPAALGGHLVCLGLQSGLPRMKLSHGSRVTIGVLASSLVAIAILFFIVVYALVVAQNAEEAVAIAALAAAGALGGQNNVAQILYVMQGRQHLAPIMPAIHIAGIAIAASAASLPTFGIILLCTRIAASIVGFLPLSYAWTSFADVATTIRASVRYASLDAAGMLAELLPIVLISGLLTREELGLIGLLRQFLTVADLPGYSMVFNAYPSLVQDPDRVGPELARANERMAWKSALGTLVLASAAAVVVYGAPVLAAALPIVLLSLPARYITNFCDQALRAAGLVREAAALTIMQVAIALPAFWLLSYVAGFWGAVAAFSGCSLVTGLVYRWAYLRRFSGAFRPLRPWRLV
jgi:hypothetical protein